MGASFSRGPIGAYAPLGACLAALNINIDLRKNALCMSMRSPAYLVGVKEYFRL